MDRAVVELGKVKASIAAAERAAGRAPGSVTLVAVSKTFDAPAIRPVIEAGHRVFGENRVQEAEGKWPALKAEFPDIELHLIGPLQSNKARQAVALFDVIETVDRDKIAAELAKEIAQARQVARRSTFRSTPALSRRRRASSPPRPLAFVTRCRDTHGLVDRRADVHPAGR